MDPALLERVRKAKDLPSLPTVVVEIVRLCRSDDFDLKDLARLLSHDPALAAKIVRAANSSIYAAAGGSVTTVPRAVSRLGTYTVSTLALSFSLVGSGSKSARAFWRRSLLSAIGARTIAKHVGALDAEECFLGGLLQDLGVLVLVKAIDEYPRIDFESEGDHLRLERLEREQLGASHADVGAWLLEQWGLPSVLSEVVRKTHSPDDPMTEPFVGCVALGRWLADIALSPEPTDITYTAADLANRWFGLNHQAVGEILGAFCEQIPEVEALFAMRLSEAGVEDILADAREALVEVSLRAAGRAAHCEALAVALAEQKSNIEHKLQRDALTGVYTRAHIERSLTLGFESSVTCERPVSVLMCDLDRFKLINDTYGHLGGDEVLRRVGAVLMNGLRQLDAVGRWGGEEFLVVLPGTNLTGAHVIAERIRQRVEELEVVLDDGRVVRPTISIGIASHVGELGTPHDMLQTADDALYAAKRDGRNRVAVGVERAGHQRITPAA